MSDVKQLSVALLLDTNRARSDLKSFSGDVNAFDRQLVGIGDAAGKGFGAAQQHTTSAKGAIRDLGQTAGQIGNQMTVGLTLPIVGAGVAAVKMSNDFDQSFSRMVGLAGVPTQEVDGLKDAVMGLAGETGQAPVDLANGLYFIESAGIHGKTALDALKVSAQASAAGMGETEQVADALTSAISAYGAENLSAAAAGDVLAATVREGKAEAASLAPEFGRLLPAATALNISFDQVGAGLAFLSRSSGDAALSATQLNGVMMAILSPSQQGAKALEDAGTSADELRKIVSEKGLLPALQFLQDKFHGNTTAMAQFFADNRALNGALLLTKDGGKGAAEVFDSLKNSTGSLGDAFDAVAGGDSFKLKQSFAELQVQLIKAGEMITPFVTGIVTGVTTVASAFGSLPRPVQGVLIAFALLVAATGPVLAVWGRVTQLWELGEKLVNRVRAAIAAKAAAMDADAASTAANTGATEASAAANGQLALSLDGVAASEDAVVASGMGVTALFAALVAAPVVVTAVLKALSDGLGLTDQGFSTWQDHLKSAGEQLGVLTDQAAGFKRADLQGDLDGIVSKTPEYASALQHAGVTTADLTDALLKGGPAWDAFESKVHSAGAASEEEKAALAGLTMAAQQSAQQALTSAVATGHLSQAQLDNAVAANKLSDGSINYVGVLGRLGPQITANTTATEADTGAKQDNADATQLSAEAQDELKGAIAGFPQLLGDIAGAFDKQYESGLSSLKLSIDYEASIDDLTKALHDNGAALDITTEKGRANDEAILKTGESIARLIEQHFAETGSIEDAQAAGAMYVENLREQLRQAGYTEAQVQSYIDTMNLTPEDIATTFSNNAPLAQLVVSKYIAEIDKVPPNVQTWIETLLAQGQYGDALQTLNNVLGVVNAIPGYKSTDVYVHVHADIPDHLTGDVQLQLTTRAFASGGLADPNEVILAAENGYELVNKPGLYQVGAHGAQITDHNTSARMMDQWKKSAFTPPQVMYPPGFTGPGSNTSAPVTIDARSTVVASQEVGAMERARLGKIAADNADRTARKVLDGFRTPIRS